ncbi:MAG: hypothetical protein ACJ768_02605 [Gaiellaceae bacterium]
MKAALESTHVLTRIDGQLCRLWKGTTEGGIPFLAFVARVAVDVDDDSAEFDRELQATGEPIELATREVLSTRMLH